MEAYAASGRLIPNGSFILCIQRDLSNKFTFIPSTGKIALSLDEGDSLEWIRLTSGEDDVLLATQLGKSIRFAETDVR